MRNFEELSTSVRIRGSRRQFDESVRAYGAGAYRSATIALWICLLLDLVEKLRILADSGDAAAKALIAEVDKARKDQDVQKMVAFEGGLLDRACSDFELITPREMTELERLRQDRHACAHPSFHGEGEEPYDMAPEQVRAYMVLVVDSVLSQPPVVGKALVERFIADTKGASWPTEDLVGYLRERYFQRARSNVMQNILRVAVKAGIRPPDEDNSIARRCVATLAAAAEIDRPQVGETIRHVLTSWRDNLSDDDLLRIVGALGVFSECWSALGPENVTRVCTLLETAGSETLIDQRAFASGPPSEPAVADKYDGAVARLDPEDLQSLTRKSYPKEQWVAGVLKELKEVGTFRSAEEVMHMVVTVAGALGLDDIKSVGEQFVRNNQINQAYDMPQLMSRLVERTSDVKGSREAWVAAVTDYRERYNPDIDPGGYYSYEDLLAELGE